MAFSSRWLDVDRNHDLEQNTLGSESLLENIKRQKALKGKPPNPQDILAGRCININLSICFSSPDEGSMIG